MPGPRAGSHELLGAVPAAFARRGGGPEGAEVGFVLPPGGPGVPAGRGGAVMGGKREGRGGLWEPFAWFLEDGSGKDWSRVYVASL